MVLRSLVERLVARRERVIDAVLAIRRDDVLNRNVSRQGNNTGKCLIEEMTEAINELRALLISADGRHVDYGRLRESAAYRRYRLDCASRLRRFDPALLATYQERLAFWINLYNLLVIDGVIAFGIRRSVTEGIVGRIRFFRRAAYNIGGYRFSCDDIEHGLLRANRGYPLLPGPHFGSRDPRRAQIVTPFDPRIHFALNCASRSCPPIAIYDAGAIDAQLDLATRSFCSDEVTVIPEKGVVEVPILFQWYIQDFGGHSGIVALLQRYLPDSKGRSWLVANALSARLVYKPYDWSLNV